MQLDEEVRTELQAIAIRCDCELLHADYSGGVLKLILDREQGVTIEECSKVSREASAFLDVLDFGTGNYTLEVSSPGLDREFYSPGDYERFQGSRIRITWMDNNQKRTDVARLLRYDPAAATGSAIEIELAGEVREIGLSDVLKTRLEPEL